jgi:hypothetical protein
LTVVLSLLAGCSDKAAGPSNATTPAATTTSASAGSSPSESSTPSSSTDKATAGALAAYRGMWADMVAASRTSDYKSPLLAQHASGAALTQIVRSLYSDQQKGLVSRGEPVLHPRAGESDLTASPQRVVVEDCADSRNWLRYSKTTGKLADSPGGNRHISADVRGVAGTWKVVDFQVRGVGTC